MYKIIKAHYPVNFPIIAPDPDPDLDSDHNPAPDQKDQYKMPCSTPGLSSCGLH